MDRPRAKQEGEESQRPRVSPNQGTETPDSQPQKPPLYKRAGLVVAASIVLAVLLIAGIICWLLLRQYVSTDDAYIDGHVMQISPQVSALVAALHIDDNQLVQKGDLLIDLDPTNYKIELDHAQAQVVSSQGRLAQARAQLATTKAVVAQAVAEVEVAQLRFGNAFREFKRIQELSDRARSKQELDNADTAQKDAAAVLAQAKARKTSADANVSSAEASVKAADGDLQTAEANQERARVNLSYCKIFAPEEGRVTERTVELGNYVAPGQTLFRLVNPNVWVVANFKETQLTHIRPGQPVTIRVDAFPGMKLRGHVDSIQAGSGARFAVLPAENATGNFVKVVQRVPVKILFDHGSNTNNAPMLSPGLSVVPRVKVR